MSKEEFFSRHKAGKKVAVEFIDGLPNLFAKQLSHGDYGCCLAEFDRPGSDKKVTRLDYAIAARLSIVTADGQPFFEDKDLPLLQSMSADGIQPFVVAFNEANGIGDGGGKSEGAEEKPSGA